MYDYSASHELPENGLMPTMITTMRDHHVTNNATKNRSNNDNNNNNNDNNNNNSAATIPPTPSETTATTKTIPSLTPPPPTPPPIQPSIESKPPPIESKPNKSESKPTSTSKSIYDASQEPFGQSFSICLKWMDDYRQLGEWLAYHYHVLPLRYLVFFKDPKSTTDPSPILFDKWGDKIQVEYWTKESDFMTKDQQKTIDNMSIETKKHRRAQRYFYHACIQHLHQMNRTWTLLIDTDEYLILDSSNIPNVPERLQTPGAALDVIHKVHANNDPTLFVATTATQQPQPQPQKIPEKWFTNCTVMARKEYPAFESSRESVLMAMTQQIPAGSSSSTSTTSILSSSNAIDPYRLTTLRFRHRGQKLIGKSMVDVSTLDMSKIGWRDVYSHNLLDSCSKGNNKGDLMYVGHYLGSMEAYQRPADRRNDWMNRTKKFYKLNAKNEPSLEIGKGDEEVRPWIQGFAKSVGLEQMQYLLQDVGFPYNASTALQQY
ncbi:unnamed protein product [Cylindrotheca closterium]|uniref:Glycosyltransferase family 92 protein n=1 Tax=Cylindrotheca closterium TaxID=2856 RepID=A0AAD2JP34_9STRA|nr:unnamed protein product [Cylindrotheca closterium]